MPRPVSACFACLSLFLLVAVLATPAPVRATTTYHFTATHESWSLLPSFSLQYNDTDNDARFSLDELVAGTFSGFTYFNKTYTTIVAVPTYNNVPGSLGYSPLTDGIGSYWSFSGGSNSLDANPWNWSESQTPVPLPATVALLGAGLLPLVWSRRKNLLR